MVTTKKLLGGFYGFQVLFPVGANNRIQGTEIDADPGAGLTDSIVSPLSLGWHFTRADAIAGYTVFVPTGRYRAGARDNTGLGMWGHELAVGTQVAASSWFRAIHAIRRKPEPGFVVNLRTELEVDLHRWSEDDSDCGN